MEEIKFNLPNREALIEKISQVSVAGRPFTSQKNYSCRMCGRSVGELGRLPFPGFPTCTKDECMVTPMSELTKLFKTPYGCAVHIDILSVFGRVVDLGDRIFMQRRPVIDRSEVLVDAYIELLKWQKAFDIFERLNTPRAYIAGAVTLVPPRRIDEVIALRAVEAPAPISPARRYDKDTARTLRRVYKKGAAGWELPF